MPRRLRTGDPAPADPDAEAPERRVVRRRSPLPNGRAVAGGFLVAVAALGVAGAHLQAGATPTTTYLVAGRDLAPGTVLRADDVRRTVVELPAGIAARTHHDPDEVTGAITLGPIAAGELVQASSLRLRQADQTPPGRELSVAVPRDRAVDGQLLPGDVVDLLATYGTGEAAFTTLVAAGASVRGTVDDAEATGLGSSGLVVLTVAVGEDELLGVAHAAHADALTVVRASGVEAPPPSGQHRPEAPDDDGDGSAGEGAADLPRAEDPS